MKLLSINLARSLWFCPMQELNPRGKSLYHIIPYLIDKYKFKVFPSEKEVPDENKGIKFEDGEFLTSTNELISINLTIYTDGLVADSRYSTNESDTFLTDLLINLHRDFSFPHFELVIRRIGYVSQLYVSNDKSLELMNQKLKKISEYLSNNVKGFGEILFELGGISFWPDQTNIIKPFTFTFERVLNVAFSENRYYSAAPLQTEKHLELLDMLEGILSE
ncbi:MAG: hypothetical protein M0P73_12680 [Syntrophobacterales bacterium]|jgi:hypothetical protein|nr:hypothetical protein [Syntrophobacterales bacterium]